jgi:MscS family membrane protein
MKTLVLWLSVALVLGLALRPALGQIYPQEVCSYVTAKDYGECLELAEDLNLRIMDIVAAAGSSFALPSQTTHVETSSGLDPARAWAAEAQAREWRERGEPYLPSVPPEKIAEIDSTLAYAADGAAPGTRPVRR